MNDFNSIQEEWQKQSMDSELNLQDMERSNQLKTQSHFIMNKIRTKMKQEIGISIFFYVILFYMGVKYWNQSQPNISVFFLMFFSWFFVVFFYFYYSYASKLDKILMFDKPVYQTLVIFSEQIKSFVKMYRTFSYLSIYIFPSILVVKFAGIFKFFQNVFDSKTLHVTFFVNIFIGLIIVVVVTELYIYFVYNRLVNQLDKIINEFDDF